MDRSSPPAPACAFRGGLSACGCAGDRVQVWETREGSSTRGQWGITQNQKGTLAQDWGMPGSQVKSSHCVAPGLSPQVSIPTLSSNLQVVGVGQDERKRTPSPGSPSVYPVISIPSHGKLPFQAQDFQMGLTKETRLPGGKSARSHLGVIQTKVALCKKTFGLVSPQAALLACPDGGESWRGGQSEGQPLRQETPSSVLTQLLISCVTLGKSLLHSEPKFSHLENEGVGCYVLGVTSPFLVL